LARLKRPSKKARNSLRTLPNGITPVRSSIRMR
jgi:hypothetical protein